MSLEANKALMHRFIDEVWNKGNLDVADELFAPDATSPSAPGLPPGPAGVKVIATMFRSAFPDYQMVLEEVLAENDRVVGRFKQSGTHLGDFMGIPPSGKRMEITEIGILRVSNGQVVESWYEADMLSLMRQIGAVPS